MEDLRTLIRQKEQELELVRREIQALLTVIPLLADAADQPSADDLTLLKRLASPAMEMSERE